MWRGGPRGNKEFLERMSALGFVAALRDAQGDLTATFRNPGNGKVLHQIDHMFVSRRLPYTLKNCFVGDKDRVFGDSLSDHLPIIAEFDVAKMQEE